MPRDTDQSQSNRQENEKPQATSNPEQNSSSSKDDEEFVDIDHGDVEMQDSDQEAQATNGLGLQRLAANDREEDDDSEDEPDQMANHPLLSMLTGRMGQRRRGSNHKWDSLHPVTMVLSPANVDDCTELENAAFPENERCTREKVSLFCLCRVSAPAKAYRLSSCLPLHAVTCSPPSRQRRQEAEGPPANILRSSSIAYLDAQNYHWGSSHDLQKLSARDRSSHQNDV